MDPGLVFNNFLRAKYPSYSVVRVANPFMFPLAGFAGSLMSVSVSQLHDVL
jgi:hypothetical protein